MSNKKIKGFKLHPDMIEILGKTAEKFGRPETTIVEVSLELFFSLPESKQRDLISKFLTKNL